MARRVHLVDPSNDDPLTIQSDIEESMREYYNNLFHIQSDDIVPSWIHNAFCNTPEVSTAGLFEACMLSKKGASCADDNVVGEMLQTLARYGTHVPHAVVTASPPSVQGPGCYGTCSLLQVDGASRGKNMFGVERLLFYLGGAQARTHPGGSTQGDNF